MEGRREGERMGSIDKGKRGREKNNKRRETKKKTLNFPEVISLNIFMYILSNVYYVISLK